MRKHFLFMLLSFLSVSMRKNCIFASNSNLKIRKSWLMAFVAAGLVFMTGFYTNITHTHTHARTHARTHAHTRTHTRAHTHTHTHSHTQTHARARARTHTYIEVRGKTDSSVAGEGGTKRAPSEPVGTSYHHVVTKCAGVTKRACRPLNLTPFVTLVTTRADTAFLLRMLVLFLTSLLHTAGHKMAAITDVFLRPSNVDC